MFRAVDVSEPRFSGDHHRVQLPGQTMLWCRVIILVTTETIIASSAAEGVEVVCFREGTPALCVVMLALLTDRGNVFGWNGFLRNHFEPACNL